MQFRTLLLLLLCAFSVWSCSARRSGEHAIPEEPFVRLYADMLILREEGSLRGSGAAISPSATDSLYRAYGVTAQEVDYTLKEHQSDLPAWKQFHEKVKQRLELLQQEMASKRVRK